MNKYLKIALEQKLKDNNIEIGQEFYAGAEDETCLYDGENLYIIDNQGDTYLLDFILSEWLSLFKDMLDVEKWEGR